MLGYADINAAAIGSAFPSGVQAKAAAVVQTIDGIPRLRGQITGLPASQVITSYETSISTLFDLNDEITSGSGDPALADDVRVELAPDKVVISRPAGLTLSTSTQTLLRSSGLRPEVFDSQLWGSDLKATYIERQSNLIAAAAEAPGKS